VTSGRPTCSSLKLSKPMRSSISAVSTAYSRLNLASRPVRGREWIRGLTVTFGVRTTIRRIDETSTPATLSTHPTRRAAAAPMGRCSA